MPSYEDIFQYSEVGQSSVTELLVGLFLPLKQFLAFCLGAEERKKTEKHEKKKKKTETKKSEQTAATFNSDLPSV